MADLVCPLLWSRYVVKISALHVVCVPACVRAYMRACVRLLHYGPLCTECVRACMHACVRACMYSIMVFSVQSVCLHACVRACVRVFVRVLHYDLRCTDMNCERDPQFF